MIEYVESLYLTNVKNTSVKNFLKKVSKPSAAKCHCIVYHRDTALKPFFDLDIYNDHIDIKDFITTVKAEFNSERVVYATNHRMTKNGPKESYHVIVSDKQTTLAELEKYSIYLEKYTNHIDIGLYRKNKAMLRFSNQIKSDGTKSTPKIYGDLKDFIITDVAEEDELYECPYDVKVSLKKRTYKQKIKKIEDSINVSDNFTPSKKQIELITKMLTDLPVKYAEDFKTWQEIGMALSNYSPHIKKIWIKFSKRSTKAGHVDCKYSTYWNSWIAKFHKKPITIKTLVHYYVKENTEQNKQKILNVLSRPTYFNRLEDITTLKNLEIIKTKFDFISQIKDDYDNYDKIRNSHSIFIKSPTGTGKTTLINDYIKTDDTKHIICLTSRITLADCVLPVFQENITHELKHYKNHTDLGVDCVCQTDSLYKINVDQLEGVEFILILDEFNSLMEHFLNPNDMMYKNRISYLEKFYQICGMATHVFCCDYDLTTKSIEFYLKNVTNTKNLLVINQPNIKNNVPITFYEHESMIYKQMDDDVKNNNYFFACSDRCQKVYEGYVQRLRTKYPDKKIVFYASLEGDTDFNNLAEKWKNAFVFTTPTILYGIDYNVMNTHGVYSIDWGNTINVCGINQQIGRVRKPTKINIYINKFADTYIDYYNFEHFKWNIKQFESLNELKFKEYTDNDVLVTSLRDFWLKNEYHNSILRCFYKFHLTNFFNEKGQYNIKTNTETTDITENLKAIEDEASKFYKLDNSNIKKRELKSLRKSIVKSIKLDLSDDLIEDYHKFNSFINYYNLDMKKKNEKEEGNDQNTFETYFKTKNHQYTLFKKAHEQLDIPMMKLSIENMNDKKLEKVLCKEIKKTFNIRNSHDGCQLLSSVYGQLFQGLINTESKREQTGGKRKQITLKVFDFDYIKENVKPVDKYKKSLFINHDEDAE